ncbi:MAG: hypothetical protein ACREP9_09340 [Candidatus Dormibacteraceae bacterium]
MVDRLNIQVLPKSMARQRFARAHELLTEAKLAVTGGRYEAALLCAVHSGRAVCDAVTLLLAGEHSTHAEHHHAVDLMLEHGTNLPEVVVRADYMQRLINHLSAEHDLTDRVARGEHTNGMISIAAHLVDWARELLMKTSFEDEEPVAAG